MRDGLAATVPQADAEPIVLEGGHVRLEPLALSHRDDLALVALDPMIWRWTTARIHSLSDLDEYLEGAMALQRAGSIIVFATIDRSTGRAIGSTRFASIDPANRRVEIGWTWLGRDFQRKAFNTEAKLLMLGHAFGPMNCIRVEFRANALNLPSRTALLRLGAKEEGILRDHMILPDGRVISWAYYSILRDEWPAVQAGLEEKLRRDR